MTEPNRSDTFVELLRRRTHRTPRAVAVCGPESESLTFRALDVLVEREARRLVERGVGSGDRVAVYSHNSVGFIVALFAIIRCGAIAVPLNTRLAREELDFQLDDADVRAAYVDDGLPFAEAVVSGRVACSMIELAEHIGMCSVMTDKQLDGAEREAPPMHVGARSDDPVLIIYTSGTTGLPKGAVITNGNVIATIKNHIVAFGYRTEREVRLSGLPMFHIGGISSIAVFAANGGQQLILPPGTFSASTALDRILRHGVTAATFVPAQWEAMLAELGDSDQLPAVTKLISGAASPKPGTLEALRNHFPNATNHNGFGMTETTSAVCSLGPDDFETHPESVGRPMLDVDMMLVDVDGREVPDDEPGEIWYRGPTVIERYWGHAAGDSDLFVDGWLRSGDVASRHPDGVHYLHDRVKDMILSGGENIYSAEIERVIAAYPGVTDVAVVAMPHERWGETPVAVIAVKSGSTPPSLGALQAWTCRSLASYKKPTSLVVLDELPRNASGKIMKHILRSEVAAR